ncbi:MAG: tRNA 2-thiouridine(34) synthase MnmA [Candidatus Zixiibacteriota bacterium]|nr:MAG: tRNA 2-thiouridine(34) synthase MnmA [candidate division Zixibacteria bacterium]
MTAHSGAAVAVAMSGGVDSSVAALLLARDGYRVVGLTMRLFDQETAQLSPDTHRGCCSLEAVYRAQAVCRTLDLPHYTVNLVADFDRYVIGDFVAEYLEGRTPNPCVRCNTWLKWGLLFDKARALGCDYLATGHYAKIEVRGGETWLLRAEDRSKDQAYALWGIPRERLARTLLPLGGLTKSRVREIAAELDLRTARTPESQEICFIPDRDYGGFLARRRPDLPVEQPGEMLEREGDTLRPAGRHRGYHHYTVGQRKGLGGGFDEPRFVLETDPRDNRVIIGRRGALAREAFTVDQPNWLIEPPAQPLPVEVQIRYRSPAVSGRVEPDGDRVRVRLDRPAEAVAPGQSAVFFQGDRVLGGGRIIQVI